MYVRQEQGYRSVYIRNIHRSVVCQTRVNSAVKQEAMRSLAVHNSYGETSIKKMKKSRTKGSNRNNEVVLQNTQNWCSQFVSPFFNLFSFLHSHLSHQTMQTSLCENLAAQPFVHVYVHKWNASLLAAFNTTDAV